MTPSWHSLPRAVCNELYEQTITSKDGKAIVQLCKSDLFFLLTVALNRMDADNDWCYARCREVEADPDGHLDLWARFHYKSTIITFALTIQDILKDPETTICIFSHTRPMAKAFLNQIKEEFENNTFLQSLFPDVLYKEPQRESPSWSLDNGICVKRKSNPKEKTIEASGLVDGQPTGKHFRTLVYDDVVTKESVSTPEQIKKTTDMWSLSLALGTPNTGTERYAGTPYHLHSTYKEIIDRGLVKLRKYPGTKDGTPEGEPVYLSPDELQKWRQKLGPYDYSSQILMNPLADEAQGFLVEWINYYDGKLDHRQMNVYLVVDPASAKKKNNDYTDMQVWGASPDQNLYLLDALHDRLNLTERADKLFLFHRLYHPRKTGYEEYGMQADVQHIQYVQAQQQYRFQIIELGGGIPKPDRIRSMIPKWETGRMWLPRRLLKRGYDGRTYDYVAQYVEQLTSFPVGQFDDGPDCTARLEDPMLGVIFPLANAGRQAYTDGNMHVVESKPVTANNKYEILPGYGIS